MAAQNGSAGGFVEVVRGERARWPRRRWVVAAAATALTALVIGVPTGVVPTPLYQRMTPTTWWDYPIWAASSILVGLTAATYVRRGDATAPAAGVSRRTMGAGLLSLFAVGCPICNKLVVALVGVSGALTWWAPLQPLLGALGVGLLATGLAVRLRGERSCRLASP